MLYLPPSPLKARSRLGSLEQTGLLSCPPGESFDRLTRFGSVVLRVPMTMITLIEADRQVVVSESGLPEPWASHRATPVEHSFCQHVVRSGEPLIVEDARRHPLVQNSPLIRDAGVIAYAGLPWRTPDGFVQGAYCAMDVLPRTWTDEEIRLLRDLADMVTELVRDRIALRRLPRAPVPDGSSLTEALLRQPLAGLCVIQDDRITFANPRFCGIVGYSEPELLALASALSLFAEDDRQEIADFFRMRLEGQPHAGRQLMRGRRKDGTIFWLEAEAERVVQAGRAAVVAIAVDLTEWKRSETVLRESEERWRLAVKAINDVTWEWEIRTGRLLWGEEAHRVLRYAPEEMGGSIDWWSERIREEDRERVTTGLNAIVSGRGTLWSDEYRLRRGDGSYAILLNRGYVLRDERGVPLRMIGAMIDVSERRRGEDAQRLLARTSALLDGSPEPDSSLSELIKLIVPDFADFCVIQLLGREPEAPGKLITAHMIPARDAHLQTPDQDSPGDDRLHPFVKESVLTAEPILLSDFGPSAWKRLRVQGEQRLDLERLEPRALIATPLTFRGEVSGALALGMAGSGRGLDTMDLLVAKDLAHRVGMALGGARLYAEAQRAILARDDILNMVSHDLRNPLSTVRMATELLRNVSPERREENRKWADVISKSTTRMDAMIDDLLDLSRIDGGRFIIDPNDHAVSELLSEIRQALEPLAGQKQIQFYCTGGNGVESIWADPRQIQRVFSNVVGNALKFTPEGGRVEVRAEPADSMVLFTVRDTGPGIPPDDLPHVFDRYWQARRSDRRGVGLGLAIAKGIVEAHGGEIWAESAPGEGATFYFTVPVRRSSRENSPCRATRGGIRKKGNCGPSIASIAR